MDHHHFSFSFLPTDTCRQQVLGLDISVSDCPDYRESGGSFGSRMIYGSIEMPHSSFAIQVSGQVNTGLDICEARCTDAMDGAIYRLQTSLTAPGDAIRAYHKTLPLEGGPYEKALTIRNSLHETFRYQPGVTGVHEPAEAALVQGQGVCQDYAHIMLSLLRMEGIPARYVTGMTMGEGASHAWVEVLCRGYWYGFDPTNNLLVDDTYIRAGCGRDSADCSIIRGTFFQRASQVQRESVTVTALEDTEEIL